MNIAIYDKAFESIMALPRGEQKAFMNMIRKAREDSTMASLHLEPISTFRDPQMRTMRINQKYRAILRAPDTGTTYTLLHVGNHDEAMAWATNKLFEWNPRTESYQVFTAAEAIPRAVAPTEPSADEPVVPGAFDAYTDEQLMDIGVPEALLASVRTVQYEPDLEQLYEYIPIEALESLSMLMEGTEYHLLVQSILDGKSNADTEEAKRDSGNNRRSFLPLDSDRLIDRMVAGDLSKWKVFLHPTQRKLVELSAKGPTKVTGGAGTGKTVAALHRARYLQDYGAATPGQGIVFTTFTKTLAQNLRRDASELGIDPDLVRITHFDELYFGLARDAGLLTPHHRIVGQMGQRPARELFAEVLEDQLGDADYDARFLASEYANVKQYHDLQTLRDYFGVSRVGRGVPLTRKGRKQVWTLFEAYETLKSERKLMDRYEVINLLSAHYEAQTEKPFRHLIADEIQDFSNVELRLLRALVPEAADDMFLVGDPMQRIYAGQVVFSHAGINVRGGRSRRLRLNYRTTEAIRRRAMAVLKDQDFTDFDEAPESKTGYRSLRAGAPPEYHTFKQRSEEADFIVAEIKKRLALGEEHFRPDDFVIATRTSSAAHDFRTPLDRAGLKYADLTDPSARGRALESGIRLSTFHNLKGLEFKVVFLADVSEGTWPLRPSSYNTWDAETQGAHVKRERSLLYVAMTRAIVDVVLTGRGGQVGELAE